MMVKDFNQHKSNGGVAMAAMIDEIKMFRYKKGNGYRAKGGPGKTCDKCGQSHLPRECPAWGKKCLKCGNKNHFSTCCRTRDRKDSLDRDQHRLNTKGEAGPGTEDMHQRTLRTDPEVDLPPKVPTA